MSSRLYKLALWYIKKCNAKWENQHKEKVESLTRLTYWNFDKYMLLYGADAEWQIFGRYDVLDNSIQRLGEYENIGTVEEFKALKEDWLNKSDRLIEYRKIGTVEECRENKEFLDFLYNRINPNDMEQYLSMYNCSDEKIN